MHGFVAAAGAAALAPAEMYLALALKGAGKVKGEARAPGHEEEIALLGWRWAAAAEMAVGGSAANARRSYAALEVDKLLDSATAVLLAALKNNDEVREARLTMRKPGGEQLDFLEIRLAQARVAKIDFVPAASGAIVETVRLSFAKVALEYRPQGSDGAAGPVHAFDDEL